MNFNANIQMMHDINTPSFLEDEFSLEWLMSRNERYCLVSLLGKIRPKVAIEVGVRTGGSLQVLSKYCEKVYALDIDPDVENHLKDHFSNVEFITGDSRVTVPQVLKQIQKNNESLEFAIIDGDHSALGVNADIENLLNYVPTTSLSIILHDSFNPTCRRGMLAVDY